METKELMERIGFRPVEVKIYLALLRLGSAKAGKISKDSRTNRAYAYDVLRRLVDTGLVSYSYIGGRKWFQPANPQRLLEMLQENENHLKKAMPELERIFRQTKVHQQVTLYKGRKGIKSVFQDILREGKPNCVFGSEGQFEERMPYYMRQFVRDQERKKIRTRMIVRAGRKVVGTKVTEIRYVPESVVSPVVTNIYGDKIAVILWTDNPEAVIIENEAAADTYRAYFELLWKVAKP